MYIHVSFLMFDFFSYTFLENLTSYALLNYFNYPTLYIFKMFW